MFIGQPDIHDNYCTIECVMLRRDEPSYSECVLTKRLGSAANFLLRESLLDKNEWKLIRINTNDITETGSIWKREEYVEYSFIFERLKHGT